MTFTDEAPAWQIGRIMWLLEERAVTGQVAARILRMLEDCPGKQVMGHNSEINKAVKDRVEREP